MNTKRLVIWAVTGLLLAVAGTTAYYYWPRRAISPDKIVPVFDMPGGYTLESMYRFTDKWGPWIAWDVLDYEEAKQAAGVYPSGISMVGGSPPVHLQGRGEITGKAGGVIGKQAVVWMKRENDPDGRVKMDTIFEYVHGPGYPPFRISVLIWGKSEEQVQKLAASLESMTFVLKEQASSPDP